jgi:hypothetical protein
MCGRVQRILSRSVRSCFLSEAQAFLRLLTTFSGVTGHSLHPSFQAGAPPTLSHRTPVNQVDVLSGSTSRSRFCGPFVPVGPGCLRLGEFGAQGRSRQRDLMGLRAFPPCTSNRRRPAMKALVPILTLILAIAFSAPAPKSQSACEKAGMTWDATASAPKVKCTPTFA